MSDHEHEDGTACGERCKKAPGELALEWTPEDERLGALLDELAVCGHFDASDELRRLDRLADAIGQEACGLALDLGREVEFWRQAQANECRLVEELKVDLLRARRETTPLYPLVLDDALVSMLERRSGSVRVEELRGPARQALANRRRMAELLAKSAEQIADLEKRLADAGAAPPDGFTPDELELLKPPPTADPNERSIYEALELAGRARDLDAVGRVVDQAAKDGLLTSAMVMQALCAMQAMRKWAELLAAIDALPAGVVEAHRGEVETRRRLAAIRLRDGA